MFDIHKLQRNLTAFNGGLVVVSGVLWITLWLINKELTSFSHVTAGINLIYLPAGFRLLIVMTFGFWGALGIFIADPILFIHEFGSRSPVELLTTAAISGFAPWMSVLAFCRVMKIQHSLAELKPHHLPLLALVVSVVTPFLLNVDFAVTSVHGFSEFMRNYAAMATGDFLGCLLVMIFVRLAVAAARLLFE